MVDWERPVRLPVVKYERLQPFLLFSSASGLGKRGVEQLVLLAHVLDEGRVWHGGVVLVRIGLQTVFGHT